VHHDSISAVVTVRESSALKDTALCRRGEKKEKVPLDRREETDV